MDAGQAVCRWSCVHSAGIGGDLSVGSPTVSRMDLHDAYRLGTDLLTQHGLSGWSLTFDNAKRRAGVCRYAARVIGLSAPLTRLHPPEQVRETLLHEIAHALVGPEHGHDRVWAATTRRIG